MSRRGTKPRFSTRYERERAPLARFLCPDTNVDAPKKGDAAVGL